MIVGVVGNPRYPGLGPILAEVAARAPSLGLQLATEPSLQELWPTELPTLNAQPLEAVLAFGGDGTLLRAAREPAARGLPILGVNLGRVGFLTTASAATLPEALEALVSGRYLVETRRALEAEVVAGNGQVTFHPLALNDLVIHKAGVARVVRLDVTIEGEVLGPYSADGLCVATPTGSTAYSLSAGGPVIVPGVDALVVTPIAAHTLAVRPVVVPGHWTITIAPLPPHQGDLLLSLDGQVATALDDAARVLVRRAADPVLLVRVGPDSFFARMRRKLHWGDLSDRLGNG